MRTGLTVSTALHAGLIALAIVGLGIGRPIEATPVESIAVDIVPVSEFSNIRMGSLESEVLETETPSVVDTEKPPELAQPTGNTEDDQPTPEDTPEPTPAPTLQTAPVPEAAEPEPAPEPVEEAAPAPAEPPAVAEPPPPEPEPEPVAEPEPAVTEPPPLATPTETPDPADAAPRPMMRTAALAEKRAQFKQQQEQARQQAAEDAKKAAEAKQAEEEKQKAEDARKAAEKKKAEEKRIEQAKADEAKKVADEVANLINMEDSRGATTGEGGQKTLGKQDGRSATLSQSEIGALVAQIRSCIAMPAGAEDADARAELYFNVAADGSLVGRPEITSAGADTIGQAYARAVARAVMQCGPYAVVAGQEVKALFQAREF